MLILKSDQFEYYGNTLIHSKSSKTPQVMASKNVTSKGPKHRQPYKAGHEKNRIIQFEQGKLTPENDQIKFGWRKV